MNICELIERCGGPEKAGIQFIDQCADSLDYNHKRGTRITFGTNQALTPEGTVKLGIVVWLDRDAVKAALTQGAA